MEKYVCTPCGYIYDPELGDPDGGIAPGTPFEDIPDDWVCPVCGLGKEVFEVTEQQLHCCASCLQGLYMMGISYHMKKQGIFVLS